MSLEERIRSLAHRFWEEEGRPHGRHEEHWNRACDEVGAPDLRMMAAASGTPSGSAPGEGHLVGAEESNDGLPDTIGVDDMNVGHMSDPSDAWPSTGRSKLAGT
jgi:hypothetical protein